MLFNATHAMDRSTESPEEDTAPLGRTPPRAGAKQVLGVVQSLRRSVRRVAEKSPLSPGGKGSKVTQKAEAGSQPPPSPVALKNEEEEKDVPPQKGPNLKRTKTDPNMSQSKSFLRQSIRRSLNLGTKEGQEKRVRREALITEEKQEEEDVEEEEDKEELEEMYTLPELPHTPLSVMQISKLIEMEVLEEAHLNLLALRWEFQQELQCCGVDSPIELVRKEKDLNLLYGDLRNKVVAIVRDSNTLPSRNKALLVPVARIIQEEERRAEEAGGLPGSWRQAWKEAVGEGVRLKVGSVHLEHREQNQSWMSLHLGLLGNAIVEDLEKVKQELRWSYPPSFRVFGVYVKSYHGVVGQHLKTLAQEASEKRDLYFLLDWITHRYQSERIMGNVLLQPEMSDQSTELQLEENLLKQLKEKYCCRVKADMRASLDRIIELERDEVWIKKKIPQKDEDFLDSPIHMDIWTQVKGNANNARNIDPELELQVIASCLEELKHFPKRFEMEFTRQCDALRPQPLWTDYHIAYINSLARLQQHMEGYLSACPLQVEGFRVEVKWLVGRLTQGLEEQFREDVKPFLRRLMTRKWLTNNEDFDQLHRRSAKLHDHCVFMRPPHVQELVGRMHYHVLKEYIGQLMKNNYSCKNRKHENAANKIRQQWDKLVDVFKDKTLTLEWLYPVGDDLCDLIGQRNKKDIKEHLEPLVQNYPDFSRKHLVAVLTFRGLLRGREHQLILQRFTQLKKKVGGGGGCDRSRVLFGDMQVNVNTDCLSNLPLPCLSYLLPHN